MKKHWVNVNMMPPTFVPEADISRLQLCLVWILKLTWHQIFMHWCHLCILKTSTCFICRYNIQKFYYSQLWCNTFFCGKRPFEICVWDQLGGKNYVVHCTTLLYFSIYFLLRIETLRNFPITFPTTVFIVSLHYYYNYNCLIP